MAQMLGDALFPESVQSRRRKLRNRLQRVREPIRQRRRNVSERLPGPNVVDEVESRAKEARTQFVQRDGLVSRLRQRNSDSQNSGSDKETEEML